MDDQFCPQCLREEGANDACARISHFLDQGLFECKKRLKANFEAGGADYDSEAVEAKNAAEVFETVKKVVQNVQSSLGSEGDGLAALCPHCGGKGRIEASLASGTLYAEVCTLCKASIGGCIVGGSSPLKEIPKSKTCPYCGGPTEYTKETEI